MAFDADSADTPDGVMGHASGLGSGLGSGLTLNEKLEAVGRARENIKAAEEQRKSEGSFSLEDMLKVADALGRLESLEQSYLYQKAEQEVTLLLTDGEEGFRMPERTSSHRQSSYKVTTEGVEHTYMSGSGKNAAPETEMIAFRPFIPVKRLKDDHGRHQYEIAWLDTSGERQTLVMTAEEMSSRTLFTRIFPDVVVTSVHVSACIEYMAQCLRYNQEWLEERCSVAATALGWSAELERGEVDIERFTSGPGRPRHVQDVKNTGDWLKGHCSSGKLEEWKEAVADCADRPLILGMISASLAAPLLRVVEAANFVVDLSGSTSGGKTIALSMAASVWGDPRRVLTSWKNTRVAQEHHLSMLRGMPFFVDETQLADEKVVEELLYGLTDGKSRGRSRQDGSAMLDAQAWETVLLTTGEQPLTSMTKKGGLSSRIVAMTGQPCRDKGQADRLKKAVRASYGLAGETFLQEIGRLGDEVLRERYEALKNALAETGATPVAQRRADSVAVMALANEVAAGIGLVPLMELESWVWLVGGGSSAVMEDEDDRPRAALRETLSWAVHNTSRFWGHESATFVPQQGWAGRWMTAVAEGSGKAYVAFDPALLKKLLADSGYDAGRVLLDWRDRGWLKHTGTTTTQPIRIEGNLSRHVVITHLVDLSEGAELEGNEEVVDSRVQWVRSLG